MPNPSSITAAQISTELGGGKLTTSQLDLTWANVRNIANISTGQIAYGNVRFGINFPGLDYYNGVSAKVYSAQSTLTIYGETINSGSGAAARANLELNSNGVMVLNTLAYAVTTRTNITWLTSGTAGDYTANYIKTAANTGVTTGAQNTAVVLSTTRTWDAFANRPTTGQLTSALYGVLRITDTTSGAVLIDRYTQIVARAERL